MPNFNEAIIVEDDRYKAVEGKPWNAKKLTGTRISKALGFNRWATPFQAWCEIMRVAEPPFTGNKYTEAGQALEPLIIEWCKDKISPYIQSPKEYYSDTQMPKYDYFQDDTIIGGMWDALVFDRPDVTSLSGIAPRAVIECKTSKRPQDWQDGVPLNYALQGLLYAYLLACDTCYFVVTFLDESDYEEISRGDFTVNDVNTVYYKMTIDDSLGSYRNIQEALQDGLTWYHKHVNRNISPVFDAVKDKEYLALIRQCDVSELITDKDEVDELDDLVSQLQTLDDTIESIEESGGIPELKKKRKAIAEKARKIVKPKLVDSDTNDSVVVFNYHFKNNVTRKSNYAKMKEDGVYDKYVTESSSVKIDRKED